MVDSEVLLGSHKSFNGNILLHLWDLSDYLRVQKDLTLLKKT